MTPRHFAPYNPNSASLDGSLCLNVSLSRTGKNMYFVDIGNSFTEVKFCVLDAVAAFNFDERNRRGCVAFSPGEGDVLAADV